MLTGATGEKERQVVDLLLSHSQIQFRARGFDEGSSQWGEVNLEQGAIIHRDYVVFDPVMLNKQVLPAHLLPFANDWGGNFFCLNLDTGAVSYFTTDNFDSDLTPEEKQEKYEKIICSNFLRFVQGLLDEDDLDEG